MVDMPDEVVALVLLRPKSGRAITAESRITSATLGEYAPDDAAADTIRRALTDAGFETGPLLGISFSIGGRPQLFEEFFHTTVEATEEGSWISRRQTGEAAAELPLTELPQDIARHVYAVTFEPPAETTEARP